MAEKFDLYDTSGKRVTSLDRNKLQELALAGKINWNGEGWPPAKTQLKTDETVGYWRMRSISIFVGQIVMWVIIGYVLLHVFTLVVVH